MGTPLVLAEQRSATPLTCKLAHLVKLSDEEKEVLFDLQSATRTIERNREIVAEGEKYESLFVVIEGVLIRYRILRDGRRQIVNIVLPGDFAGLTGCLFEGSLYSIRTLTRSVISVVPFARLNALANTHPRLASKIFWSFSCEAAIYAERLIAIGRRSALERVAHFLLELLKRLQVVGLADELSYRIPLTQELIADALGLSIPHVNRVLKQLRDEGLVGVEGQQIMIRDLKGLTNLAEFEPSYLNRFSYEDTLAPIREPMAATA